jgi:3-dehydroquinate synthase
VQTVPVSFPGAEYQITIDPGLLSRVGQELRKLSPSKSVAVLTDSHVAPLHLATLEESLKAAGFAPAIALIPAGEQHKSLSMLLPVYDQFLIAKIERTTPVLALGGGVIGDMAGFVAATILRGVPFVQIPTSLLAMVDASIGGKTGVDHTTGKNLIGAFHQPIAVFIDPLTLTSLPPEQLQSGLAECIKHDLIRDAAHFQQLPELIDRVRALEPDALVSLIAHNVAIKARVVQADPFERGERAHLNFGHTFGHAIETVSSFSYSHGQSVALGMTAAAYTSQKLGLIDESARAQIVRTIEHTGLPIHGLELDPARILETMKFDKKVKAGQIRLILLQGIGNPILRDDVPVDLIVEAIASLR